MNKTIKLSILVALALVVSILFWHQTSLLLHAQLTTILVRLVFFCIFFFIFMAIEGLLMVLIGDRLWAYGGLLVSGLTAFLFFSFSLLCLCGLIIFFACLVGAYEMIKREKKVYVKMIFGRIMKRGKLLTVLALMILTAVFSYVNSPVLHLKPTDKIKVPENILDVIPQQFLNGFLSGYFPFYQAGMTVDEFISAQQAAATNKGKVSKPIKLLSPSLLRTAEKNLSKNIGVEVNGQDKVESLLSKLAADKLGGVISGILVGKYQSKIAIGLSAVYALLIFSFFVPFAFLSVWVAGILFLLLRLIGFVKVKKVQKEIEELEI